MTERYKVYEYVSGRKLDLTLASTDLVKYVIMLDGVTVYNINYYNQRISIKIYWSVEHNPQVWDLVKTIYGKNELIIEFPEVMM